MKNLLVSIAALCCFSGYANSAVVAFPQQCDRSPDSNIVCQGQSTANTSSGVVVVSQGVCAVPTSPAGYTKGICSAPLQTPPAWPNSSSNDHTKTAGGEGHAAGYFNGCASGYADVLQTSPGTIDAGYGCCSSVTKIVTSDPRNGAHFQYVGEACDPVRGSGGANGAVKDCCGGSIPLTCASSGARANTCCIPTGSAGAANSTGYADPFPGWCCSGYASKNGTNMCLASPDGGNGGCQTTGCGAGYCDTASSNCMPLDLGEPCEYKVSGDGFETGWTRTSQIGAWGGQPTIACVGGFCGHESSPLTYNVDPVARCCLDRDLQPADGGLPCHQASDCCVGVCQSDGFCGKASNNQTCYDDGDCLKGAQFGICVWTNGGFGVCQANLTWGTCVGDGGTCTNARDCCDGPPGFGAAICLASGKCSN